jgi:hypothetical protein
MALKLFKHPIPATPDHTAALILPETEAIAGDVAVAFGGANSLSRRVSRKPRRFVRASLKQVIRMADDIEHGHSSLPGASS